MNWEYELELELKQLTDLVALNRQTCNESRFKNLPVI